MHYNSIITIVSTISRWKTSFWSWQINMAFLETVRCWNEGVVAFQEDRYKDSLLSFNNILEPSARIQFNIACVLKGLSRENDCIVVWILDHSLDRYTQITQIMRHSVTFKIIMLTNVHVYKLLIKKGHHKQLINMHVHTHCSLYEYIL